MYSLKPRLHLRQKQHKHGDLRTLSLDVTSTCNLKCAKCYAEVFAGTKPVALEVLKKAVDEAYRLGVYHYVLQGGEPITEPSRLEAILRMIYPEETYINVVSNGWMMTSERIRWLKDLNVDKISFSLDSGIEKEHDAERGAGSYARVLEAIDDVLAQGLLSSISTVVTHQSLYSKGFKLAYDHAQKKGIRIDVQIAEPVGKWDGRREILMTPEDTRYIKELQIKSPFLSNGQRMVSRDIYSGDRDHCPAGGEFMAIANDGSVLPCNFLHYSLGNIRDRSLADMRQDLLTCGWFDGKHPVCLCGEDREFIDKFVMPFVGKQKPLDAYELFDLNRRDPYGKV